ncbi:hypothetical protein C8Q79DRAFT_119500 [Trametes meyenii]|nr:hypothetical protein C8Q79DRAFT_119500 [Trametes meyenii]
MAVTRARGRVQVGGPHSLHRTYPALSTPSETVLYRSTRVSGERVHPRPPSLSSFYQLSPLSLAAHPRGPSPRILFPSATFRHTFSPQHLLSVLDSHLRCHSQSSIHHTPVCRSCYCPAPFQQTNAGAPEYRAYVHSPSEVCTVVTAPLYSTTPASASTSKVAHDFSFLDTLYIVVVLPMKLESAFIRYLSVTTSTPVYTCSLNISTFQPPKHTTFAAYILRISTAGSIHRFLGYGLLLPSEDQTKVGPPQTRLRRDGHVTALRITCTGR